MSFVDQNEPGLPTEAMFGMCFKPMGVRKSGLSDHLMGHDWTSVPPAGSSRGRRSRHGGLVQTQSKNPAVSLAERTGERIGTCVQQGFMTTSFKMLWTYSTSMGIKEWYLQSVPKDVGPAFHIYKERLVRKQPRWRR